MKAVSKSRSRWLRKRGPASHRLSLLVLESRTQPGSLLTAGLDLAVLGSALGQDAAGPKDDTGTAALHPSHHLNLDSVQPGTAHADGSVSIAPYQVRHHATDTPSSLTLGMGSSSNLGLSDQGLALAAAHAHLPPPPATSAAAGSAGGGVMLSVDRSRPSPQTTRGDLTSSVQALPAPATASAAAATPIRMYPGNAKIIHLSGQSGLAPRITGNTV